MDVQTKFAKITKTKQLPTLPEVAQQLIQLANQPDPDVAEVVRLIKSDPATCCKILKTVNSALFAFRPRIQTIEQAIPKLGMSLIRTLILNFHLASMKSKDVCCRSLIQDHWKCSITQAVIAEGIAQSVGEDEHFFFMAGMLQDIGVLAMITEFPKECRKNVYNKVRFPDVISAESTFFGFNHVDVTAKILQRWNMGDRLIRLVKNHHGKDDSQVNKQAAILQSATKGAEIIANASQGPAPDSSEFRQYIEFIASQFDISPQQTGELMFDVVDRTNEISATYSIDIGEPLCTETLIKNANEILHEIALKCQVDQIGRTPTSRTPRATCNPEDNELYVDCMTGLLNRRFLNEVLKQKIEDWIESNEPVAIIFLDADNFKPINDLHGHAAGDAAIVHIGNWISKNTRGDDHVVRLGGDEFIVVLQADFETVKHIVNRIIDDVPDVKLENGNSLSISLSAGCAVSPCSNDKILDVDDMIEFADQLMYQAKQDGGGVCQIRRYGKTPNVLQRLFGFSAANR